MWKPAKRIAGKPNHAKDMLLTRLATRIVAAKLQLVKALSRMEQKLNARQKKILLLTGTTLGGMYFLYILAGGLLRPVMAPSPLPDYGPAINRYPGMSPPLTMPQSPEDSARGLPPPILYDSSTQHF